MKNDWKIVDAHSIEVSEPLASDKLPVGHQINDDESENLPDQYEVIVKLYKVEAESAANICEYNPDKSVEYQLRIEDSYSKKYSEERFLKIGNLSPDHEYFIKATIYDADNKAIGMSKTRFKTPKSSLTDDLVTASQPITFDETDGEE